MLCKAETLIKRLRQHASDYENGTTQDFEKVCVDCKIAAEMIETLKISKHTQKRRRQRLSKKNREKQSKIDYLTTMINTIKD